MTKEIEDTLAEAEIAEDLVVGEPEDCEDEIPGLDEDVATKDAAGKAAKQVRQAKKNIQDVQDYVRKNSDDFTDLRIPEPYREILVRDEYFEDLNRCFDIIKKYEQQGFRAHLATVNDDLITLQGALVRLSMIVGFFSGVSVQSENQVKISRAGAYIVAKRARDALKTVVTDSDADNISKAVTKQMDEDSRQTATVASVIRNGYFAITRFADQLEKIAQRQHKQEYSNARTGG